MSTARCAQAGSPGWNFFLGWRFAFLAGGLRSCGPAALGWGRSLKPTTSFPLSAEVIINDRSAISPSGHERRAAHPRRISSRLLKNLVLERFSWRLRVEEAK